MDLATYFISDIHGEYDLFCGLLEKIGFCGGDTMYVLGDFLDKGSHPVKLAKLLSSVPGVKGICGNHEYFFLSYYHSLMRNFKDGGDIDGVLVKLQNYFHGETESLTWDAVDFIESLPRYIETVDFICVHAGVELDENGGIIPLGKQQPNRLIFDRSLACEEVVPKNSKTILFGHTPCNYINGTGQFIKTPRPGRDPTSSRLNDFAKIRLDTGVSYTKLLGTLRLEDMREFYVSGSGGAGRGHI